MARKTESTATKIVNAMTSAKIFTLEDANLPASRAERDRNTTRHFDIVNADLYSKRAVLIYLNQYLGLELPNASFDIEMVDLLFEEIAEEISKRNITDAQLENFVRNRRVNDFIATGSGFHAVCAELTPAGDVIDLIDPENPTFDSLSTRMLWQGEKPRAISLTD